MQAPVPASEGVKSEAHLAIEEPPAVAKTQPIRINPRPSSLPPVREENTSTPGELPRLDIGLAGNETGHSSESLSVDSGAGQGRTKVQLPQPGEATQAFSPGDFIVPAGAADESLPEFAIDPISDPLPMVPPEPRIDFAIEESHSGDKNSDPTEPILPLETEELVVQEATTEPKTIPLDLAADLGLDFVKLEEELESVSAVDEIEPEAISEPGEVGTEELTTPLLDDEEPLADSSEIGESLDELFDSVLPNVELEEVFPLEEISNASVGAPKAHEDSILNIFAEADQKVVPEIEPDTATLSEGSFETLLSEQTLTSEAIDQGNKAPKNFRKLNSPAKEESSQEDAFPEEFAQVEKREVKPDSPPVRGKTGFLGDFFASSPFKKEGDPQRSTMVLISIIGAVAILATSAMILAVNGFGGGWTVEQVDEDTVTPPPRMSENPPEQRNISPIESATLNGDATPAVINTDLIEQEVTKSGISNQAFVTPVNANSDPTVPAEPVVGGQSVMETLDAQKNEKPALSFDERVQSIVNGTGGSSDTSSNLSPAVESITPSAIVEPTVGEFSTGLANPAFPSKVNPIEPYDRGANDRRAKPLTGPENYNPPESFKAPGPSDAPLGKTHDLLDAFLRAPDWESRIKYIYNGESLRPAIREYYQKWPDSTTDHFSIQLFQMEQDVALGGPYWVYLVSTSDLDQGYPIIIREENGFLKVDWEIFSEFHDKHFVKFQEGAIASPRTLRVVVERVSDYFGPDREGFSDLSDYFVYQINPPYGDLNEFSTYAFVKKNSSLAGQLESVVGLSDEPLAVIVTLEEKAFPHGIRHLVVTDYLTEGWFR
tara:strand:+ start:4215 stop:6704 length:2490 start_codon:yes stop_codon:yes gene_type:complete